MLNPSMIVNFYNNFQKSHINCNFGKWLIEKIKNDYPDDYNIIYKKYMNEIHEMYYSNNDSLVIYYFTVYFNTSK